MTALFDGAPTPIVILLFALLIYASIKYGRWSSPGGFRFGTNHPPVLFGNTNKAIFRVAGGSDSSEFFKSASLPDERLF